MGALLAREQTASKMQKGDHAATFGGGPLLCAAALASLTVIEDEGLVDRSARMGRYLVDKLEGLELEAVREIRGKGLMVGMELAVKCGPVVDYARENGVLLNCTSDSVLRFVPPLVITQEQIDRVIDVVAEGIERAK